MRHADTLDPADVALLDMAVTQIEAAPYSFDIRRGYEKRRISPCGSVLCIGGHMCALAIPGILKRRLPDNYILSWMDSLCNKNRLWFNLFFEFEWKDQFITADNLSERVEHWKDTSE